MRRTHKNVNTYFFVHEQATAMAQRGRVLATLVRAALRGGAIRTDVDVLLGDAEDTARELRGLIVQLGETERP